MPTTDNSYAARTARRRQQAMSAFHRAFPTRSEQGPRGDVTDSSTYLARRLGDMGIRIESAGGAVVDVCCAGGGGVEPIDTAQDVYVIGYYASSPLTIYNRDGSEFTTLPFSGGAYDAYIVKYNTSGFALWATHIGGSQYDDGFGISVDMAGNAYVTGYYGSTPVTIYNSDGGIFGTLSGSPNGSAFVVKYDTDGIAQWATRIISQDRFVSGAYGISVTKNGTVHATGAYQGTIEIYNSNNTLYGTLTSSGGNDVFLVKYSTTGAVLWATHIGGTSSDNGTGVYVDISENVYVTGHYNSSPVTIYNQDNTSFGTLINSGFSDAYIVKYDPTGFGIWATRIANINGDFGFSITVDITGNVYVSGYFTLVTTFYNADTTVFQSCTGYGSADAYIVKYNSSGFGIWYIRIGGNGFDGAYSISLDIQGNVYITGFYSDTGVNIENSDHTLFKTLTNTGINDIFVVKYNTNGFGAWAAQIGGNNRESSYGIAVDNDGNAYVTGDYQSSLLTIYNADDTVFGTLTNSGNYDTFIVKYNTMGSAQWATRIAGSAYEGGFSISVPRLV